MTDAQLWALLDEAAETRDEAPIDTASPALAGKLADLQRLPTRYRVWWDTQAESAQHVMTTGTVRDTAAAIRPVVMLVDSSHRVLPLLRSSVLAERWAKPSALEHWSNAGLAGHLARSSFNLERALGVSGDDRDHALDAVGYYAATAPDAPESPIGRRIRELGDAEAADGPQTLADRFAASTARLQECALQIDPATTVVMFNRVPSLDDCATACLLELVIHTDDLAVSLGVEPPEFDGQAVDLVAATLTRISRKRHGDTAVIHALARTERVVGRER